MKKDEKVLRSSALKVMRDKQIGWASDLKHALELNQISAGNRNEVAAWVVELELSVLKLGQELLRLEAEGVED